jgi:hypothetical protein
METISNGAARSMSLGRAAESMLRALGGAEVRLRLALPVALDAQRSALGLEPRPAEEVPLSPVVARPMPAAGSPRRRYELLILLQQALGIVHRGKLLRVELVAAENFASMPYLYRVTASE